MSELAVKGCKLKFSSLSPSDSVSCDAAQIITPPSTNVLVSNNGVYRGTITVNMPMGATCVYALATAGGASSTSGKTIIPQTIDITGTASNVLADSQVCVQKGDKGSKAIAFQFETASSPYVTIINVPVTVEISDAGQTDVIAS